MKRCIRNNLCSDFSTLKKASGVPGDYKEKVDTAAEEVLWEEHDDVWKMKWGLDCGRT